MKMGLLKIINEYETLIDREKVIYKHLIDNNDDRYLISYSVAKINCYIDIVRKLNRLWLDNEKENK